MGYVLATASMPRNEIDIEIMVFKTEGDLVEHLVGLDLEKSDIEFLVDTGKLALEDESFAVNVV